MILSRLTTADVGAPRLDAISRITPSIRARTTTRRPLRHEVDVGRAEIEGLR